MPRQCLDERMERPIATAAKNRQRVRELEVVEVSQHDHVRPRVGRQEFVDEGPHHVRLRAALRLRAARWWLDGGGQRGGGAGPGRRRRGGPRLVRKRNAGRMSPPGPPPSALLNGSIWR